MCRRIFALSKQRNNDNNKVVIMDKKMKAVVINNDLDAYRVTADMEEVDKEVFYRALIKKKVAVEYAKDPYIALIMEPNRELIGIEWINPDVCVNGFAQIRYFLDKSYLPASKKAAKANK